AGASFQNCSFSSPLLPRILQALGASIDVVWAEELIDLKKMLLSPLVKHENMKPIRDDLKSAFITHRISLESDKTFWAELQESESWPWLKEALDSVQQEHKKRQGEVNFREI